jgi:site-specific DNA recombinase
MVKETIRVAIYARVSTAEQAEEGFSIDAQLRTLTEYCKATGKILYKEYVDRGVSGKSMKGRLALQQLLKDAEEGQFDEVIVWKINRMARKQLDLLKIVEALTKLNISFRSYSENFETETPIGKFALQMMGAVGELERNTIVDNVKWE